MPPMAQDISEPARPRAYSPLYIPTGLRASKQATEETQCLKQLYVRLDLYERTCRTDNIPH